MAVDHKSDPPGSPNSDPQAIAARFVDARRQCQPLSGFPGTIPASLAAAYRIQDNAIGLWDDDVRGWKVGKIPVALEGAMQIDRLAGPIFASNIVSSDGDETVDMPVFEGGFAAVEAEFVAVIGADAPAGKNSWTIAEAASMIADMRIGLEIASSPLATINELGPTVVASDFGNNRGLIVGPSIANWQSRSLETMRCETFIDDQLVGSGGAFTLAGGFVRSVQFLLELNAPRGKPLRAGDLIATGQTTGIHDVVAGQTVRVMFGNDGALACRIMVASP